MDVPDPIFGKRLSQDDFAKLFIERLRESCETGPIEYDPERFRIVKPEGHPSYIDLHVLYLESIQQVYAEQQDRLDKQYRREGAEIFVASYMMRQCDDGQVVSCCTWTEGVDTVLPKTDEIHFTRLCGPNQMEVIPGGGWDTVRSVVGDLMEIQGTCPERWRVRSFPTEAMLRQFPKFVW